MVPRRSTRIANVPSAPGPAVVEGRILRKRKTSTETEATQRAKRKKKDRSKAKVPNIHLRRQQAPSTSEDALSVLPAEIQFNILHHIDDSRAMINLACTSQRYYNLAMSIVHNHIAVRVGFFAHIPKVIRRLEPHLSIAQKKQIRREGRYKGQQERFSSLLDRNAVPKCALNVRQMTIGGIDPGKKHRPIVVRYLEEVLKNLTNLEVLDTTELNASMAHSIAALKHLKALRVTDSCTGCITDDNAFPLSQLSGLKHLAFHAGMFSGLVTGRQKVLQTILARSLSTLMTLDVRALRYSSNFLEDFEDRIEEQDPDALEQPHYFTALKSLTLTGHCWEGERALLWTDLNKSIDFLQLRELKFTRLGEGNVILFKHLEDLFGRADKGSIQLRKLSVDMDADQPNPVASEKHLESIYRFLASFDTLTSLNLLEHNVFYRNVCYNSDFVNPGLSRRLQQVVIIHKHLESLQFKYQGHAPYYVSAQAVEVFTKNLPRLRILEIAPDENDLDALARSISYAKNLRTLIFANIPSWLSEDRRKDPVQTFLQGFMGSLLHISGDIEDFTWAKAYTLAKLTVAIYTFAIGDDFLKPPQKKMNPPIEISKDDKAVWLQDTRVNEGGGQWYYTANSAWASHIMTSI
ncbi:uncharacterized protein B0J16DRAFT_340956 [Fusarium flagelliforme]|uniref:uncharacterized protein n=1 Tax=Fusarium flagelliforme TaxID=2675880 RepID=UPI001E8CF68F|nr:uncharacterized protein B0J16DRAFT_340956 [Fusarium flagelliforme]KAH7185153.1 hypothetical protein B0J16DRAFT_340956 [Fusarium flagelliforme]